MKCSQIAATSFFAPLTPLHHPLMCCLRRARSASRSKPSPKAGSRKAKVSGSGGRKRNRLGEFFWSRPGAGLRLLEPGHAARIARALLEKEKRANCTRCLFRPLDRFRQRVSLLLAPSTERE